ncbi:hypothetical protein F444_19752 [Phytophthora nicotianae P1976]|uniref:Uncharacterized protein n=1 Tax=Phytophthora nicotianae P1976 TaxID=1317066 RepID=A0A080Z6R6_PHYNI|nr:hypothetical protein F444_19752 [Phytophthora nicotianae P1976]
MHCLRFGGYAVEFPPSEKLSRRRTSFRSTTQKTKVTRRVMEKHSIHCPDQLVMPKTKKLHAIIEATANKVQGHPKLESMLKIKLGDNKKFRF